LIIFLILYIIFFLGDSKKEVVIQAPPTKENLVPNQEEHLDPISIFLTDEKSVASGIIFLQSAQYIYSFDSKKSSADSSKFLKQFQTIQDIAVNKKILIDNITEVYLSKSEELKNTVSAETKPFILEQRAKNSLIEKKNPN
jgi:hypothetical protein